MLSCREAARLMSQELDRELTWSERLALKLHVMVCNGCRNFRRQMGVLREVCRHYGESGGAGD